MNYQKDAKKKIYDSHHKSTKCTKYFTFLLHFNTPPNGKNPISLSQEDGGLEEGLLDANERLISN